MAKVILTVLGSGSRGNSLHLEHEGRAILVDAGLSAKQLETRMAEVGAEMVEILGIVLTHEHGDHSAGLKTFVKKRKCPIFASHGTKDALEPHVATADWRGFEAGSKLEIGCFIVETFPVPHDAAEPIGMRVSVGETKIGLISDLGFVTRLVVERLKGCTALVLEALSRRKDTWVLDCRNDDATGPFRGQAAKGQVVRFGTTTGKNRRIALHSLRPGLAQLQQPIASVLDGASSNASGSVLAGGVDLPLAEDLRKMLSDTRVDLGCGIVIEINQGKFCGLAMG
jgi:phosphoribosyl 1,2-cyclic phosphodiesterase